MDQENVSKSGQKEETTPLEKLEIAINEYLASCQDDRTSPGGILTGWVLLMEEQHMVSGESYFARAVKDLQSLSTTLGLISYAEKRYSSRIADM